MRTAMTCYGTVSGSLEDQLTEYHRHITARNILDRTPQGFPEEDLKATSESVDLTTRNRDFFLTNRAIWQTEPTNFIHQPDTTSKCHRVIPLLKPSMPV
jgi:hypothetical protein